MKIRKKTLTFFLAVFLFFGIVLVRQQFIIYKLKKQYGSLQNKLKDVNMQNVKYQGETGDSQNDDYIKMQASEKLRLIKPGELLFIDEARAKISTTDSN